MCKPGIDCNYFVGRAYPYLSLSWVFPVYVQMYSLFNPETLPFQVVHLSEGLISTAEHRKGSWIKDMGRSFPTKSQTHPTAGVDQAKCVRPRQDKWALFLATHTVDKMATSDAGSRGMWLTAKEKKKKKKITVDPWPTSLTLTKQSTYRTSHFSERYN